MKFNLKPGVRVLCCAASSILLGNLGERLRAADTAIALSLSCDNK